MQGATPLHVIEEIRQVRRTHRMQTIVMMSVFTTVIFSEHIITGGTALAEIIIQVLT